MTNSVKACFCALPAINSENLHFDPCRHCGRGPIYLINTKLTQEDIDRITIEVFNVMEQSAIDRDEQKLLT